jgi:hypothetical protein
VAGSDLGQMRYQGRRWKYASGDRFRNKSARAIVPGCGGYVTLDIASYSPTFYSTSFITADFGLSYHRYDRPRTETYARHDTPEFLKVDTQCFGLY